jgi:hypothetical protein
LLKNAIDKILIGSTIFENTNNLQWTILLDAAGACPATYTKNTTTRNGNSVYDDATLFEFLILETFKPGSAGLILNKGEFQKSV